MMARIRTVKPDFWTDEKVVSMSPLARLFFIGLWNFVDDDGRAPYSPARLKMQILPNDSADVSEILGEIRREKLVVVYEVDGKEYFQVCGFAKHQKIDKRTASKYPSPPIFPEPSGRVGQEGKGKEGKEDAEPSGSHPKNDEADLFERGKKVLGKDAGGLIAKLLKSKKEIPLARAAIEMAATKQNPREYIGRVLTGPARAGPVLMENGQPYPEGII